MGEQDQVAQQEPRTAQEHALELLRACLVRERVGVASYAPLYQNEVPTDFSDAPACCSDGWREGSLNLAKHAFRLREEVRLRGGAVA